MGTPWTCLMQLYAAVHHINSGEVGHMQVTSTNYKSHHSEHRFAGNTWRKFKIIDSPNAL